MAKRVDRDVDLRGFPPFGAVIARPCAALGGALQRAPIQDHGAGRRLPIVGHAKQRAQVKHERLETPGRHLAHRLLVDDFPRGRVVRHRAPRRARADHPAQRIVYVARGMVALPGVFAAEREIRGQRTPTPRR